MKKSNVWKFFTHSENEKAKCNLCGKMYSRKGRCTSGLITHLKQKHCNEYTSFEEKQRKDLEQQSTSASAHAPSIQPKQTTLECAFEKIPDWESTHPKSKELDKVIAEMLALESLPFNFVESTGFKRVMKAAVPRYHMRSRQFFTELLCDHLFEEMCGKIRLILQQFEKFSFTTDVWSDPSACVSLLSLTAHGISSEMKKVNIILKCEPLEGSHTGCLIAEKLTTMLADWGLSNKVHCVVRDKGSNMIRAMNLADVPHIDCTVHKLQNCLKVGLASDKMITKLIEKSKKLATHFNHSLQAQEELGKIQQERLKQSPLGVVQDCPTRWNSTFYMLERFLKIRDSITLYITENNKVSFSAEDWLVMKKCVAVLKPFEETTRKLSKSAVSVASVIPLLYVLKCGLTDAANKNDSPLNVKVLIEKITVEINSKFGDSLKNKIFSIATYLDPRYKTKFFDKFGKAEVKADVLRMLEIANSNELETSTSPPKKRFILSSTCNKATPSSQVQESLARILQDDEGPKTLKDERNQSAKFIALLDEYESMPKADLSSDPLQWWLSNGSHFKALLPLVRQYLSAPPGSVPSEQLFSGAGLIYTPLRNQLKGEKAAKLLFIKYNLPLINIDY